MSQIYNPLATEMGQELIASAIRSIGINVIGDLTQLKTSAKTDLVSALNECKNVYYGYLHTDGKFYREQIIVGYYYNDAFYEDSEHATEITPVAGKIYEDAVSGDTYGWDDELTEYAAENPTEVSGQTDALFVDTSAKIIYSWNGSVFSNLLSNLQPKEQGKGLSTNDYTDADKATVGTVSSKADKVTGGTTDNLAGLDATGNIKDAGWSSLKTTTSISGNPISISGLKSNQLAIDPVITFEPIQAGSGIPSPSNVRAISGYDKIEVLSCGKNIWNDSKMVLGGIDVNTGQDVSDSTYHYWRYGNNDDFIAVLPNEKYFVKRPNGYAYETHNNNIYFYDVNKNIIYCLQNIADTTVTTPANCRYVRIQAYFVTPTNTYPSGGMLNEGETAITYEPYHKTTDLSESIGQTVYGGSLDLRSGKLTVTEVKEVIATITAYQTSGAHHYIGQYLAGMKNVGESVVDDCVCDKLPFTNNGVSGTLGFYHTINAVVICVPDSYSVADFNTNIAGGEIVYPLATPFTIQLTPHEISLLKDYAYVSTNGTNIALDYHNGELASLADVSQLGETVNLGSKVKYEEIVNMIVSNHFSDNHIFVIKYGQLIIVQGYFITSVEIPNNTTCMRIPNQIFIGKYQYGYIASTNGTMYTFQAIPNTDNISIANNALPAGTYSIFGVFAIQ